MGLKVCNSPFGNILVVKMQNREELLVTEELLRSIRQILTVYSSYISHYIDYLNGLISVQRRVSTLRFERMTLIKYVKKLRFLNEKLHGWDFPTELDKTALHELMDPLASYLVRVLEILDLLNFYVSQPLKSETISKTLNENLVVGDKTVDAINETYRLFIKCVQWMVESQPQQVNQSSLAIELIQFTRKCAIEDGVKLEDSMDILLQDVALVENSGEYAQLLSDWADILMEKQSVLNEIFAEDMKSWHGKFNQKK